MFSPPFWRTVALAVFTTVLAAAALRAESPSPEAVLTLMRRAADWQLAVPIKPGERRVSWEHGTFYAGAMALGDVDARYQDKLAQLGARLGWQLGPAPYFVDDHAVGQMYAEMFLRRRQPEMLAPLREKLDFILAHPPDDEMNFEKRGKNWWWCDALFMGPPTWLRVYGATGNRAYLDFADRNWRLVSEAFYDKDERLYYRDSRFIPLRDPAGAKIFWSRGNGWVFAGLARILQFMPDDYPGRPFYVQRFQEMAARVLELQHPHGSWHPSLLEPKDTGEPEASGTGFFCYGFAWGVNHGLLDRAQYEPAIWRAWEMLASFVQPDGKVGQTQPGGDRPAAFDPNNNEAFGAGAFLLAGSEVYRLALLGDAPRAEVTVSSALDAARERETVEIPWADVVARLPQATPENLAVLESRSANPLMTQVLPASDGKPQTLLFQADFAPKQFQRFDLVAKAGLPKPEPAARSYARFVPERMDDFAWENDRTAHRMYGPALEKTGEISSGVDVWSKHTHKMLLDEWYKTGDYHKDHGDGGDFYKTGPTLGCGGSGLWWQDKLYTSKNFEHWKILANGPIRSTFVLTYAPWGGGNGSEYSEAKTISLDAGSNLNRFAVHLAPQNDGSAGMPSFAAGITKRPAAGGLTDYLGEGWLSYWSPADPGNNGDIGCAVVLPANAKARFAEEKANLLAVMDARPAHEEEVIYYAGGGWSKGDFPTRESWEAYVSGFAARLRSPLRVAFTPAAKAAP